MGPVSPIRESYPSDFYRIPTSIEHIKKWGAVELRFLLYSGQAILKGIWPPQKYEHFLYLHFAIRILAAGWFATLYEDSIQLWPATS